MPGFPVAADEPCDFTSTDQQPSPLDTSVELSISEKVTGEWTFTGFCKPIEFYNVLLHRPRLFLPRCLKYRINASQEKRIQMTVLLSWSDEETQNMFPLYISLARRDPNNEDADYSAVYLLSQILTFRGSSGIDGRNEIKAKFVLSEVNKLAVEARSGSLFLLFFTTEGNSNSLSRINASLGPSDQTSHESIAEKTCLYGKISFQSIYTAWDDSPNFRWGQRAEIMTTLNLLPCILKYDFENKGTAIAIQDLQNSEIVTTSKSVHIKIFAEEFGAKEKSPYHANAINDVPSSSASSSSSTPSSPLSSSSSSCVIRSKEGRVVFNYRYYKNRLQRREVTENFSCPYCYLKCASYKGLRCHLLASHDLLNFEFSASEDCLAVNVSKKYDIWRFEFIADGIDPRLQTFMHRGKRTRQVRPEDARFEEVQDVDSPALADNADPPVLATDVDLPVLANDVDSPVLAITNNADPPVLAMDLDPLVLANDADSPVLALINNADPPVLAMDVDPPVLANDAGSPVLANDAGSPVLANDVDSPLLAMDSDPPILAIDEDPPILAMDADPPVFDSETTLEDIEFLKKADGNSATTSGVANTNIVSNLDPDCVPPVSEHDNGTPSAQQAGNTRKLPVEHFSPQMIAQLTKREFFHSHKAQPMSLEEVLSGYDSEAEVDDEVLDIEDRWRLNLHDNATKEEKQLMTMWNSFIRRQRVRVDAHVRWACKAFTIKHGSEIVKSRELSEYWTVFRLKLYSEGLIDSTIINDCGTVLKHYRANPDTQYPEDKIPAILLSPVKNRRKR